MSPAPLQLHPDRLLPVDPGVRSIARRLHDAVTDLPIISPHGHVPAQLLVDDAPFANPASLFVQPDHYVTRLLHAAGVPLERLGVGQGPLADEDARKVWRELCSHWPLFRGTPVRYWLESALAGIFDVTQRPSEDNADLLFDQIEERLAQDSSRPRTLLQRFGIDVLATTDDPCDDLAAHLKLREDATMATRVVPTFRPDRYLEPAAPAWPGDIQRLARAADVDTTSYVGWVGAMAVRRRYFVEHGAVSADHSHVDVGTEPLDVADAERIYTTALHGDVSADEAAALRRHMLMEMARLSTQDGLVMTLHPGVSRNHHSPTFARFGADTGHDIPVQVEFTRALQPLLERYGTDPNLHLVLFTLDETTFSREIAPLAGFYPSVYAGAPWWFLDAPDAIRRYRSAVTETTGFAKTSGFIDDTRAFCSIPARHDMARRLDCGYLGGLVAEHRLDEDEALETAVALVTDIPRKAFKL